MKRILKSLYNAIPGKKYFFSVLRHLKLPRRIYQHLHFKGVFAVTFDQYKFLVRHYGFQVENEIFWAGLTQGWEKISMQLWIDLCKDAEYILDIGANTGVYSLVAKAIDPKNKVFAFEPVTRVYDKLVANNNLNGFDIQCFELAVSNKNGTAVIYDTPSEHVYSVTVNKNLNPDQPFVETWIHTKKLSSFIEEKKLPRVDLIKIDVETHEPEVLEGMQDYLTKFRPTLLIEILNDEVGRQVQTLVEGLDYLYFNIDEVNAPKLVNAITRSGYYNYLICNRATAQQLKLI